jgi:hypothetical protein
MQVNYAKRTIVDEYTTTEYAHAFLSVHLIVHVSAIKA